MQQRRILVVEYEPDIAQLIALNLRDEDFDVTIAEDGHEGMRLNTRLHSRSHRSVLK